MLTFSFSFAFISYKTMPSQAAAQKERRLGEGLAQRYRPRTFKEVVEQQAAVQAIQNALSTKHSSPAYLFFGPRGVGKTSLARLIARRVNCQSLKAGEPCELCESCQEIEKGSSMDVIEIDAASHRGIDYIRELRENVKFRPMSFYKKVYIIDEVHMLTLESFNALLKTLEEPPEHALFVLATTEYHKVPQTIISRCQVFNLRKIPLLRLQEHLAEICKKEKIEAEEEALFWIARAGDGSLRDSISFLEQSMHYCGKKLTSKKVKELIHNIPLEFFFEISHALLKKKSSTQELLFPLREKFSSGESDLQRFVWEYLGFLRILMYIKKGILDPDFLELPASQIAQLSSQFAGYDEADIQIIFQELFALLKKSQNLALRNSFEMRTLVEMEFLSIKEKLGRPSIAGVLQKLNQFSAALSGAPAYSFEHELQKEFLGTVVAASEQSSPSTGKGPK